MGRAKDIIVRVIPANIANAFVKKHHYSGKVVNNSALHFGAFLDDMLHGVMSFGSPLDKRKVLGLVEGTKWNEMLELNRMAFDEHLPRNSESRCISVAIKLLKKNAPHIKWILSFADGTQCGDGAIYRASGFVLCGISKNAGIYQMPDGTVEHLTVFMDGSNGGGIKKRKWGYRESEGPKKFFERIGAQKIPGFQLRYIYLIDKSCKLTVPTIPFEKIDELNAGMYKGEKITIAARRAGSIASDATSNQDGEGGANPTPALKVNEAV